MVMHNPHFDLTKVTNEDIARGELHYAPIMDASDPTCPRSRPMAASSFSTTDGTIPAYPRILARISRARAATMGEIDDFYRLYMVRGCFTAAAECADQCGLAGGNRGLG